MEIIASAILGRSSFTFGLSRIIRFYLQVGALSIKQDLQTRPKLHDAEGDALVRPFARKFDRLGWVSQNESLPSGAGEQGTNGPDVVP